MEVGIQEVVPKRKTRTALGRVVINPPNVTGPLKHREVGRFFMCCNRAFLTEESYKQHQSEVTEHGKPLDFSTLPKSPPPTPLQPDTKAIHDPSSREFWIQRKKGVPDKDKVFQVDGEKSELGDFVRETDTEQLERVTVMDIDSSRHAQRARNYKKCDVCNLSTGKLSRHMKICHTNGPHKCSYCPCTFNARASRSLHQRRMHPIQVIAPAVSQKQTIVARAKKQLLSTKLMKDMELQWKTSKVLQCPVCKKVFKKLHPAREHLNSHSGVKPLKCDQCAMAFTHSSGLKRHKKSLHSLVPSHFCSACNAGFPSSQSLHSHFRSVHVEKSDDRVNEIQSSPTDKSAVVRSQGIYDDPLPTLGLPTLNASGMYECHVCNKQLTTPQTWRGHMLIHQNMKPYKCKLCGASFRLNGTRSSHIKTCHTNGPYKCTHCTCSFNVLRARDRHLRICRYAFRAKTSISNNNVKKDKPNSDLLKEIIGATAPNVAGFRCNLCGVVLKLKTDFSNHELLHSSASRSTCNLCLKKFSGVHNAEMHKQRAHGSGIYKCTFCCCQYCSTQALFKHLTLEHGMHRYEWDFKKRCIIPEACRRIQLTSRESEMDMKNNTEELIATVSTVSNSVQPIPKRMTECDLCHLKVTFGSLRIHKRTSHFHEGKYKCLDCPCKFMAMSGLLIHRSKYHGHIGKKKAKKARAASKSKLERGNAFLVATNSSVLALKESSERIVTLCDKTFQDESGFRKHVEAHQAGIEKEFECDLCHLRFANRSSIFKHKRKSHFHSGTFQCSKCPCKFLSLAGLSNHRHAYHGFVGSQNKNTKCLVRSKIIGTGSVFKKVSLMKRKYMTLTHKRSAGVFQCSICNKLLSSQYSLDLHLGTHTGNGKKNFQCDLCHLKFLHPGSICHHKKRCHYHNGKYKCSKCSCKFLAMGGLINHKTKFHGWIGKEKRRQLEQATDTGLNDIIEGTDDPIPTENSQKKTIKYPGYNECKLCHLLIPVATKMQQHLQNCHLHDGCFQCSFCACKFKTLSGLSRHNKLISHKTMTVANNRKLEKKNAPAVRVRDTAFGTKRLLKSTEKTRISTFSKAQKVLKKTKQKFGALGPTCASCGCKFSRKNVLVKHMRVAHSNGAFKCKYCNCSFHHAFGLARHVAWHETGHASGKLKSDESKKTAKVANAFTRNEDIENKNETLHKNKKHATSKVNLNFLKIRGEAYLEKKRSVFKVANTSTLLTTTESPQNEQNSVEVGPLSPPKRPKSPEYKCNQCGIRFLNKSNLENHSEKAHVIGGFNCNECPCTFANGAALTVHKRVYHDLIRKAAGFGMRKLKPASSSTVDVSPVKHHESQIQQNSSAVVNDIRDKWSDLVTVGMPERTSESCTAEAKQDKITPVNSLVSSSSSSEQHQCTWCTKSFPTKRRLSRHMVCHTRPRQCPKCDLRFRTQDEVLKHIQTHHVEGQYQCSGCSCRFATEKGRNQHFTAIHRKKMPSLLNKPAFVIEHEQEEEDDNVDQPFIQINSTFSLGGDNAEFGDESEPIVQGILDGNYSSDFSRNAEEIINEQDAEEGTSSLSYLVSQDKTRAEESIVENSRDPIIRHVSKENENTSGSNPTPSSTPGLVRETSAMDQFTTFPTEFNQFRPITCETCNITCFGPEHFQLHMESHKTLQADKVTSEQANSVEGNSNVNEGRDSLKCNTCGNKFLNSEELAKHARIEHDKSGLYRCVYCPCIMKTETNLRYHFMKYHDVSC